MATGARVVGLRVDTIFEDLLSNPGGYGFTDTTRPCIPVPGYALAASCATAVFFDDLHPTTAAHRVVAQAALSAVVPEPATVALTAAGLGVLAAAGVRRRRAA
jgi:phospholipase/lecithinase/hemolysin